MRIDHGCILGVRLLKKVDMEGFVYHLVDREPDLAQQLSDAIAFQIQDNDIVAKLSTKPNKYKGNFYDDVTKRFYKWNDLQEIYAIRTENQQNLQEKNNASKI